MNTHILIPIKDIEDRIKTLALKRDNEHKKGNDKSALRIEYTIVEITSIFESAKKISLDEKDIEDKALNYHASINTESKTVNNYFKYEGYKQALKDLL